MRRLRKWLWITCVAGSVVVGVLAIGLGVRSFEDTFDVLAEHVYRLRP